MNSAVRAFIAVRVAPTETLRTVLTEFTQLGRSLRPVAPENLHVTLKFLGETDESWIPRVARLLTDVAAQTERFAITLNGLGAFRGRPSFGPESHLPNR